MSLPSASRRFGRLAVTVSTLFLLVLLALSPVFVLGRAAAAPRGDDGTPTPGIIRAVGFDGGAVDCDGWTVTIPQGIVPDGGYVHCGNFNPDLAPAAPSGFSLRRHTININIYDNNNQWITVFGEPLTFCFRYNAADVAAAGGDVRKFTVASAPIEGAWSVSLTTVDPTLGQACARVDHLTLFDLAILTGTPSTFATAVVAGTAAPTAATPAPGATAVSGSFTSVTFRFGYRYTVQPGDNLFRIALRYRTTVVAIRAANNLASNLIAVGQVLIVPSNFAIGPSTAAPAAATPTARAPLSTTQPTRQPTRSAAGTQSAAPTRTHVVQPGENLFRIAIQYNTTVADIQKANGLTSTTIFVGQTLTIPGR